MASEPPPPTNIAGVAIDIVGIEKGDRGRSCSKHRVCGACVKVGTLVRLRLKSIIVNGLDEVAISVHLVKDGKDGCCVGFAPRHLIRHYTQYDGGRARVKEVYDRNDPTSATKRRKVHHNHGFAVAVMLGNKTKSVKTIKTEHANPTPPTPPTSKRPKKSDDNE